MLDSKAIARQHLLESCSVKRLVAEQCLEAIEQAGNLMAHTLSQGGKILLCGNGGSAADCQHIAAEFTSRLRGDFERPALPAIALTTDTAFLTARANDYSFDEVFARLIEALGRKGDVLIAISTSGSSRNVVRAVERCQQSGISTVGLLGGNGGSLRSLVDIPIVVPSSSTQYVQEAHSAIGHILCQLSEEKVFQGIKAKDQYELLER